MDITVETRYRVSIGDTFLDLNEADATMLMETLQQRLPPRIGVAPVETRVHLVTPAVLPAPDAVKALPESVPDLATPTRRVSRGTALSEDEERQIRALAAEGFSAPKIANRLGRSVGTIYPALRRLGITPGKDGTPPPPRPQRVPPAPDAETPPLAANAPLVRTDSGDTWTHEQTRSLIHLMANGSGISVAMRATGHSFLSCERRWRHLKEAGLATVQQYTAHQESTTDGVPA